MGSPRWNSGARLYEYVEAWSGLGEHRVGTETDQAGLASFTDELVRLGATVQRQPFTFDRFDAHTEVTVAGSEVRSDALFYESVTTVDTGTPFTAAVDVTTGDRTSTALQTAIDTARSSGAEAAVIATSNPLGELVMPNRYPRLGSGLPVVLVPGRHAQALAAGPVRVRFTAKIVPGESANVIGTLGDVSAPGARPLLIATPLSGWFTCAAERATGIAVALALAERFAGAHPVLVVGSPAHDILHHVGLQHYLDSFDADPSLIVHLGANVALGARTAPDGPVALAPGISDVHALPTVGRGLFVRMDEDRYAAMTPALERAGLSPILNPPKWFGEGALWAQASSAPLLSFVGIDPAFHTPADIATETTSPQALATVAAAIGDAIADCLG